MNLSWELLNELADEYGDPFYLVYPDRFKSNYQEFLSAFKRIYPRTQLAYSYKTNYTPKLCQLVNQMGGYAEVVSSMEYELANRVGVLPHRIIFNGPFKRESDLAKVLRAGSIVNLDSFYEVAMVEKIAKNSPDQQVTIGLRCNFDIGAATVSRFGFDVTRPEFHTVLQTLRGLDNCRIAGLHCHFMPPQRSAESYGKIAHKMLDLAAILSGDGSLRFIDLGGGFFSKMNESLKKQFGYSIPSYEEYAQAISMPFAVRYGPDSGPELILEPGIALTADVMQFVSKTVDIKTVGERSVALLSGSIYEVKPMLSPRNLPVTVFNQQPNAQLEGTKTLDLVGYTCMEGDLLYQGYKGNLRQGDFVVFDNVGAYTNVLKPPFINPAPPMIAYNANTAGFDLIRRREESKDIFSTYVF